MYHGLLCHLREPLATLVTTGTCVHTVLCMSSTALLASNALLSWTVVHGHRQRTTHGLDVTMLTHALFFSSTVDCLAVLKGLRCPHKETIHSGFSLLGGSFIKLFVAIGNAAVLLQQRPAARVPTPTRFPASVPAGLPTLPTTAHVLAAAASLQHQRAATPHPADVPTQWWTSGSRVRPPAAWSGHRRRLRSTWGVLSGGQPAKAGSVGLPVLERCPTHRLFFSWS